MVLRVRAGGGRSAPSHALGAMPALGRHEKTARSKARDFGKRGAVEC